MTTSGGNENAAQDPQVAQGEVVQDEDEHGGRARRRRERMSKDELVQSEEARVHGRRTGIVTVGVLTILISAWGALIPFVEPMFGFHATGTPAWRWNAAHTLLAVVPGVVGVMMGLVVLSAASKVAVGRGRMSLALAGVITILSGAWFIVGPRAWPVISTHGVYFAPAAPLRGFLYQLGYALGTGVILVVCGGYVVGWASRHQLSDAANSAGVRSAMASEPTAVDAERVVPRKTSERASVSVDPIRRNPDSREPLVRQLLKPKE
jgi:hypothetical protein